MSHFLETSSSFSNLSNYNSQNQKSNLEDTSFGSTSANSVSSLNPSKSKQKMKAKPKEQFNDDGENDGKRRRVQRACDVSTWMIIESHELSEAQL